MTSLRTALIVLIALAIGFALMVVAFRVDPEPVDLHVLTRGPMEVIVNADGVTRVREVYEVSSPVAGLARRSPLRVGDIVVAGETVVAVVEPAAAPILDARSRAQAEATLSESQAALRAAEAEIRAAEEEHRYAEAQNERMVEMVERGISTLTALEDTELRLAATAAALSAAQSRRDMALGGVERAEAVLELPEVDTGACCHEIVAPVSGVVLHVDALSARTVQAGTRMLTLGDPTDLEIVADLLSSDAVRLPELATASLERWGGEAALSAVLRRVDPVARTDVSALGIEEQRVDAVFDLLTPPEARVGLGENYGVYLRIVLWRTDDALLVPLAATFRDDEGWAAFVNTGGIAELRRIDLGRIGEDMAEVLAGVEAGEQVILHPSTTLDQGTAVTPRGSGE